MERYISESVANGNCLNNMLDNGTRGQDVCGQTRLNKWTRRSAAGRGDDRKANVGKQRRKARLRHFFPASTASPFLHAIILIFGAVTISFDSILNEASLTMNVHTSSHSR